MPINPELRSDLAYYIRYSVRRGKLFRGLDRTTAYRHLQRPYAQAYGRALVPQGRQVSTHTLRHSAARHWLANNVPLNVVSNWLLLQSQMTARRTTGVHHDKTSYGLMPSSLSESLTSSGTTSFS